MIIFVLASHARTHSTSVMLTTRLPNQSWWRVTHFLNPRHKLPDVFCLLGEESLDHTFTEQETMFREFQRVRNGPNWCSKMGLKRCSCKCWISRGLRSETTHLQLLRTATFCRHFLLCFLCPILLRLFCGMAIKHMHHIVLPFLSPSPPSSRVLDTPLFLWNAYYFYSISSTNPVMVSFLWPIYALGMRVRKGAIGDVTLRICRTQTSFMIAPRPVKLTDRNINDIPSPRDYTVNYSGSIEDVQLQFPALRQLFLYVVTLALFPWDSFLYACAAFKFLWNRIFMKLRFWSFSELMLHRERVCLVARLVHPSQWGKRKEHKD